MLDKAFAQLPDKTNLILHSDQGWQYTNSELKQMYYKGEITRQEYEDETGETLE